MMQNEEWVNLIEYFADTHKTESKSTVQVTETHETQEAYCLAVPGTAFLTSIDGKTSVTGNCHVSFMKYQISELFDLSPGSADSILLKNTIIRATEEEIEWAHVTIGDNILGMSKKSQEQYLKYLANQRAKLVGLGVLYKGYNENPYSYLEKEDENMRENFFETTVTGYSQSAAVSGWDDF